MRALLLCLFLASPAPGQAKRLELGYPNLAERIQIVFPAGFDPSRKWPVILYYHGTNGKPDTSLIRHHTGEEDWFTVGMTYVQQGKFTFTPQSLADELTILQSVRHHLVTKYSADPQRVYVAGFSKGGWMAGLLLQADPQLAGAAILGAGHVHEVKANPPRFSRRTPVFLGIGRKDGNYPFALRAVTFYRGLGGTTTLETWPDLAHQFPEDGAPGLRQWLALEGRPEADHRAAAAEWFEDAFPEAKGIPDPVNRWVALRELGGLPYHDLLDEKHKTALADEVASLERTAVVSTEARALAAHRGILRDEISTRSKENYRKCLTAYHRLASEFPNTRQGELARHDHARIERLLQHFDEQEEMRRDELEPFGPEPEDAPFDPNGPRPDRRIPLNPLVR